MSWRLRNSIGLNLKQLCSFGELKRDSEDINRAWTNINQNIKTSANDSVGPSV
jgi:hypothetical protein